MLTDPVVFVVVRMPGCSGLDLQRRLIEEGYDLPVIFLSAHADVAVAVRPIRAGALQVFTKPFDDQALLDTVYEALTQDRDRRVQREELAAVRRRLAQLTAREREVMTLVVTGMPNKQIASELGTSEKTVKSQRGRVHVQDAGAVACRTGPHGGSAVADWRFDTTAVRVAATRFCRWTKVACRRALGPMDQRVSCAI